MRSASIRELKNKTSEIVRRAARAGTSGGLLTLVKARFGLSASVAAGEKRK